MTRILGIVAAIALIATGLTLGAAVIARHSQPAAHAPTAPTTSAPTILDDGAGYYHQAPSVHSRIDDSTRRHAA